MANFDIPNPEELKPGKPYNYDLIPEEYDINQNRSTNTYDQFIMLRDTLVYSKKYYQGKAGSTLIIGDTEETVEVKFKNKRLQKMNPNRKTSPSTDMNSRLEGPYVTLDGIDRAIYGTLSCKITKDGFYNIKHKEEIILTEHDPDDPDATGTTQIKCYIEHYAVDQDGNYPATGNPIAVYDLKSASQYTLDEMFSKLTSQGEIETNLKRGDILALRMVDQDGNDLELQGNRSNRWSVEYITLPLKD